MSTTFVLILVVAGAYMAAHIVFEWLARHFSIISGAEYLLLGILLGPQVSGLIRVDVVGEFAPFMTLALGWIGAVVGAQFSLPAISQMSRRNARVAFIEAVLSFTVVTALMVGAMTWLLGISLAAAVVPAVAMGAVATASTPSGIAVLRSMSGGERAEPLVRQLAVTTAADALVAITVFGLLVSVAHAPPETVGRSPTATEWAVISIAIGVVGGILFHLFLGGERQIDRLFIALAGAIILVSGAAAYLRLSPLFPAMLIGIILVNTSPSRAEIQEVLGRVERPLYFVLLIFAGAAWEAGGVAWSIPALFIVARITAKMSGGWAAAALSGATPELGPGWGRALLGQGGLAIAIGLSYQVGGHPWADLVFTGAILSVLLTDLSSARLARSVLRSSHRSAAARSGAPADPASASDPMAGDG